MITENLNQVFRNYIDKFDYMNDKDHNESYKWIAVEHFQRNWDIDALDFISMFKEAVSKTDNLINNSKIHPSAGILKLAEHDEEAVRELFRNLYKDDQGDLIKRQDQIDEFNYRIKELLEKYEKGKWSYAHDIRTIISYLCLRYPEDNYFYKPSEAKMLAESMDYADDWGAGQSFKLIKYYKMCDTLVEEIKGQPELLNLQSSRLKDGMFTDESLHILAYDLIYCAKNYNLYTNLPVPKIPSRKVIVDNNGRADGQNKQTERVKLQCQIDELRNRLEELEFEIENLEKVSLLGKTVNHKVYGWGDVTSQIDSYVEIRFKGEYKRFPLSSVFSDKFLEIGDYRITELSSCHTELKKQEEMLKYELMKAEYEIKKII